MRQIRTKNNHVGECPNGIAFPVTKGSTFTKFWGPAVALLALFCVAQVAHGSMTLLDFENSTASSTLAEDGTGEIRWANIVTVDNVSVDLVATVSGPLEEYNSYNLNGNGKNGSGKFGRLNLADNHSAEFTFSLVDPLSADAPVATSFLFSVMDIDSGPTDYGDPRAGIESVHLIDPDFGYNYTVSASTELIINSPIENTPQQSWWPHPPFGTSSPLFTAGTPGTGADNPSDPLALTNQQEDRTVLFNFTDTDSFRLRFSIGQSLVPEGAEPSGRNFIFSGNAIFDQDTTTEVVPEPASVISWTLLGVVGCIATWWKRRR